MVFLDGRPRAMWLDMMVAILLFGVGALVATAIAGGMLNLLFVTVFRTRA